MPMLKTLWVLALACAAAPSLRAQAPPLPPREWRFEARLDGEPIGEHVFRLSAGAQGLQLASDARFTVRVLGIPVYRYRHQAHEQWQGGCLASLRSDTEDGGKPSSVRAAPAEGGLRVDAPAPGRLLPGCVMGFAYWHPAMRRQAQLLDPQTGQLEPVRIQQLEAGTVDVRGAPVAAVRWRIALRDQAIDVWYAAAGDDWLGLDSSLAGGRRLSYRLR
ncbi:DUF6134 family protein [uncultured Ramlibacter sp.]|uniref:DUF6134 family protein n=1 Tax=uncultured Ramlibacter sp. TaxID=260755 RepID=UPI00261D7E14|nr:DUF6134 family protein [uncultured Ramlibacter sp.]